MDKLLESSWLFLLIFARMIGFVVLNPFFGKKILPAMVKVCLAGALSFPAFLNASQQQQGACEENLIGFGVLALLELCLGFMFGFVADCVLSAIVFGGELFDMQMGFSASKFFDPTSGAEISISGSLIRVLFMFVFFLSGAHINMLGIIFKSFQVIPLGQVLNFKTACLFFLDFSKEILTIGVKMVMPMMAAILIMDIGVGVLMKAIPQLNVFVLNIYVKLIVGFLLLLKMGPNFIEFSHKLTNTLFVGMERLIGTLH
ncbi:MAG: flagellar biosynthetic protein FliR [Oscillospiraceae bacterium]|jgi:flagellar biosynthetic protein FliR|nr:flagellar biosynthetic protein FliR [Oscillospiraceae bacterium]